MKANELRLGNWVEYPNYNNDGTNKYFKIRDIYTDDDRISLTDSRIQLPSSNLKYINPIKLTEEILLKCGFKKDSYEDASWLEFSNFLCIGDLATSDNKEYVSDMNTDTLRIKYLHELQNLHFALTGQELIIEPL